MSITSIDVGGIICQYFAVGAGEPIVLLHCTGHSGRQWAELAAALRTDFEVIAPDLCGYGGTAHWPGSGTFNLGIEADLVAALVERLNRPAHIVGHSFGGAVALQLALRHPDLVKSLTVIEPAAFHLLCDGDDEDKRALRQISEIATTHCKRRQLRRLRRSDAALCRLLDRQWRMGRPTTPATDCACEPDQQGDARLLGDTQRTRHVSAILSASKCLH